MWDPEIELKSSWCLARPKPQILEKYNLIVFIHLATPFDIVTFYISSECLLLWTVQLREDEITL